MFLFAISRARPATSGRLWPKNPTLQNFDIVFQQKHFYLEPLLAADGQLAVDRRRGGGSDAVRATCAAFAISRLKVRGGRTVMNLALFTYFIPAAFLAVPMYKTMGNYGLLNNQWALILAMVTIASPYCIWVLKQARQAALGTGRGRQAWTAPRPAAVPPGVPAADGAVAGGGGHLFAAAGLERIPLRLPAAVQGHRRDTLAVALGSFLSADDSPWELLMATGLIYALPPAAIYYAFKRYMVTGLTAGAVKS
jgi:multiple sugar transport system permease protein